MRERKNEKKTPNGEEKKGNVQQKREEHEMHSGPATGGPGQGGLRQGCLADFC